MKFKSDIEVQAGLKDSSGAIGASGQVLSSTGSNVSWVNQTTIANDVQNRVKAGVAINKGQAVYVTGADGTNIIVGLASNATEATSSKTLGLLNATVAINGFADVVQIGRLSGLNTIGAVVGDPVWLGTNGNLIYGLANKPYAPAHLVFIGVVTRVNSNNGEIFINVQNGFELKEIHDVDIITTVPINGDVLGYNGTLWVNKTIAQWLGYTPANASGTTNYVSKFTGTTTLGNSLIYDNGTNVGIGTTTPSEKLHVSGGNIIVNTDQAIGWGDRTTQIVGVTGPGGIMRFDVNNAERMRINASGNVGIGTTSPQADLHVYRTGSTAFQTIGLKVNHECNGDDFVVLFTGNESVSSNRFVMTQPGNIGIGTSTPSEKLEVNGNIGLAKTGETFIYNTQSATDSISIGGASYVSFKTYGGGFTEKMRIDTSGNVGIGTSAPAAANKLEVNGRAFTDQLQYTRSIDITSGDLDNYTTAGFYNGNSMTNAPNSGWFWVTVERYTADAGWCHQTATSFGSGNTANIVYTRTKTGGVWQPWKTLTSSSDISGTTNYVSKFTSANTLSNSQLFDNGTNVGIGTTLSVNIFLASAPVLDNIPIRESLARVPMFTHSDDDIKENPERLIFKYIIPKLLVSALQASQKIQ